MKLLVLAAVALSSMPALAAPKYVVRWAVAHDPGNPAYNAMLKKFGDRIRTESHGALALKLDPLPAGDPLYHRMALKKVMGGKLEMSQVSTSDLGTYAPTVHVLSAPFLFEDHTQSTKVMDSEIGRDLLAGVLKGTNGHVRALDFTYSGGYRQIYGTKELRRVEDFKGLRMLEPSMRMSWELLDRLGVEWVGDPGVLRSKTAKQIEKGQIDGEESEYARAGQFTRSRRIGVVNDTNHVLFTTMIIVNENFYSSLPDDLRDVLTRAVRSLALEERSASIELEQTMRRALVARGKKVVQMTPEEHARFVAAAAPVYAKFEGTPIGDYVKRTAPC